MIFRTIDNITYTILQSDFIFDHPLDYIAHNGDIIVLISHLDYKYPIMTIVK